MYLRIGDYMGIWFSMSKCISVREDMVGWVWVWAWVYVVIGVISNCFCVSVCMYLCELIVVVWIVWVSVVCVNVNVG